jgi:hypothetical protein
VCVQCFYGLYIFSDVNSFCFCDDTKKNKLRMGEEQEKNVCIQVHEGLDGKYKAGSVKAIRMYNA